MGQEASLCQKLMGVLGGRVQVSDVTQSVGIPNTHVDGGRGEAESKD